MHGPLASEIRGRHSAGSLPRGMKTDASLSLPRISRAASSAIPAVARCMPGCGMEKMIAVRPSAQPFTMPSQAAAIVMIAVRRSLITSASAPSSMPSENVAAPRSTFTTVISRHSALGSGSVRLFVRACMNRVALSAKELQRGARWTARYPTRAISRARFHQLPQLSARRGVDIACRTAGPRKCPQLHRRGCVRGRDPGHQDRVLVWLQATCGPSGGTSRQRGIQPKACPRFPGPSESRVAGPPELPLPRVVRSKLMPAQDSKVRSRPRSASTPAASRHDVPSPLRRRCRTALQSMFGATRRRPALCCGPSPPGLGGKCPLGTGGSLSNGHRRAGGCARSAIPSPVGVTVAASTIKMIVLSRARVRWTTPCGTV